MVVDFHVHSTASDGTLPPRKLVGRAAYGGFAAMALTDHDNTDGAAEFEAAVRKAKDAGAGTLFVHGIELSIEPGETFDRFHLLGLGIDPNDDFRRIGIGDIAPEPHGEVLARPHFAKWLVDNGYAGTIAEAFGKYLLPDSPPETRCYEERFRPSQEETFKVIHGAGGLCVMAHPKYWRRAWKTAGSDFAAAERELARLKEAGLDGLEAIYQANRPSENVGFCEIALRLGLLASAGSDFHGSNKPAISLGMEVDDRFIAPLLERLGQ